MKIIRKWKILLLMGLLLGCCFTGCGVPLGRLGGQKTHRPSEPAKKIVAYLDCPCEVFPSAKGAEALQKEWYAAMEQGKREGFTPVLVPVEDTLWTMLTVHTTGTDGKTPSMEEIRAYREKILNSTGLTDGAAYFQMAASEGTLPSEIPFPEIEKKDMSGGEGSGRLSLPLLTDEIILARIPTEKPWEVFAWVPMGGWNSCPDTPEMVSVAKYWHDSYGAVPAVLGGDLLDFYVEKPPENLETAQRLLWEQCCFCPDLLEGLIGMDENVDAEEVMDAPDGEKYLIDRTHPAADSLTKSSVWTFWWD